MVLEPLAIGDVEQLLANRYGALQLDPGRPWRLPVVTALVHRLYELFRGDLRGMLKALEDGITALLGLTSAGADVAPGEGSACWSGRRWIRLQSSPRLSW